jgi:hypothetical protein
MRCRRRKTCTPFARRVRRAAVSTAHCAPPSHTRAAIKCATTSSRGISPTPSSIPAPSAPRCSGVGKRSRFMSRRNIVCQNFEMYFITKEIVHHHRHGTIKRVASSGKSELILNNRNMEVLLPEAGMMEKQKKRNKIQRTPAECYPKVSYIN